MREDQENVFVCKSWWDVEWGSTNEQSRSLNEKTFDVNKIKVDTTSHLFTNIQALLIPPFIQKMEK